MNNNLKMIDEKYMLQCLEMAEEGAPKVSPNPMVGSIVLDSNGNVVGRGYHKKYGGPHAEVFALDEAAERAEKGTLYVSLEPCCHHGKTPPCVNRVIKSGVQRVVVAMKDPNPRVAGRSIELMKAAGIEVTCGILEQQAIELNKAFVKYMNTGYPLVISKIAMTLDGKVATRTGSSKWISSEESRLLAHHWRNRLDCVLTGSSTILADDSRLTCRIPGGKDPIRVVIDSQLVTSPEGRVYSNESPAQTVLVTSNQLESEKLAKFGKNQNVTIYKSPLGEDGKVVLPELLKYLASEHRVHSILLETGPTLNGAMLKAGLIDKFYIFLAPKIVGDNEAFSPISGINTLDIANSVMLHKVKLRQIADDILIKAWVKDEYRLQS